MNLDLQKDEEILNKALDKSFVINERMFKGNKVGKFTLGTRIVMNQIREEADTTEFFIWSSLYCLTHPRSELVKLAWDKAKFREAVLNWSDEFNEADFIEGVKIVDEIFSEIAEARVQTNGGNDSPK
jgi:hypothetical protein